MGQVRKGLGIQVVKSICRVCKEIRAVVNVAQ